MKTFLSLKSLKKYQANRQKDMRYNVQVLKRSTNETKMSAI